MWDRLLRKDQLNRFERRRLVRRLSAGPWCWPPIGSDEATRWLESRLGFRRPVGTTGVALAVAVKETDSSLWALMPASSGSSKQDRLPLGKDAEQAWNTAAIALPRSVPVLWRSVKAAHEQRLCATLLVQRAKVGHQAIRDRVVDGHSFGLAMALSLASTVFNIPAPEDLVASAQIDEKGQVYPVEALDDKLKIIDTDATRVRRILVSAEQVDELRSNYAGRVEIIGVGCIAEAVDLAFPSVASRLREIGKDRADRAEILQSLFRVAVGDRSAAICWKPIERAADEALQHWTELTPTESTTLAFVRAVAARHERNEVQRVETSDEWLDSLTMSLRIKVLAHLTQQSADTGEPSAEAVCEKSKRYLVCTNDAFDEHLRLLGANGRLLAVLGRPEEALEAQTAVARAWCDRFQWNEAAMPLCEWLRLAAALGDSASTEQALCLNDEIRMRTDLDAIGLAFLDFSVARSKVFRGHDSHAADILERLSVNGSIPRHLRLSAERWLTRARLWDDSSAGGTEERELEEETLTTSTVKEGSWREFFRCFQQLDAALKTRHLLNAERALAQAKAIMPQPLKQMLNHVQEARRGRWERVAYVADFYPY